MRFTGEQLIDGVIADELHLIPDGRGYLQEIMRSDSMIHKGYKWGQVYASAIYKDTIKAWHLHTEQTDFVCCVSGMIKLALHDTRTGSKTRDITNVFYIGEQAPALVRIPKGIYHGWQGLAPISLVVNMPDKMYNYKCPDEQRAAPHSFVTSIWGKEEG